MNNIINVFLSFIWNCVIKASFHKKNIFIYIFLDRFNMSISKIVFLNKKKYYFNIFTNKNILKNNNYNIFKYPFHFIHLIVIENLKYQMPWLQKPKKSKIQFFLKLITRTKPSKRECTWNIVLPIETTFAVDFIVTEIADLISSKVIR